MRRELILATVTCYIAFFYLLPGCSNETSSEKFKARKLEAIDTIKATGREIDNNICETINGQLKCLPKKMKNELDTTVDKARTEIITK